MSVFCQCLSVSDVPSVQVQVLIEEPSLVLPFGHCSMGISGPVAGRIRCLLAKHRRSHRKAIYNLNVNQFHLVCLHLASVSAWENVPMSYKACLQRKPGHIKAPEKSGGHTGGRADAKTSQCSLLSACSQHSNLHSHAPLVFKHTFICQDEWLWYRIHQGFSDMKETSLSSLQAQKKRRARKHGHLFRLGIIYKIHCSSTCQFQICLSTDEKGAA